MWNLKNNKLTNITPQKHEVSKYCGKNGAARLACPWDAPHLQLVKNKASVRHNEAKHNGVSYACTVNLFQ